MSESTAATIVMAEVKATAPQMAEINNRRGSTVCATAGCTTLRIRSTTLTQRTLSQQPPIQRFGLVLPLPDPDRRTRELKYYRADFVLQLRGRRQFRRCRKREWHGVRRLRLQLDFDEGELAGIGVDHIVFDATGSEIRLPFGHRGKSFAV
jgi:hypothetical protein